LVFERQVAEQCLVERLCLLGEGLDCRGGTPDERPDHVGQAAELADGRLDGFRAFTGIGGVLREFAADCVSPGLRDPGLRDLDLGIGQFEHGAQLRYQCRLGNGHGVSPLALTDCVGAGCTSDSATRLPRGTNPDVGVV
jgi:hypothetical protein